MTRRFWSLFALALAGLLASRCSLCADTTNTAPDFKEVYDLLRTNLAGATDETLNRAAVEGLLAKLHDRAAIVSGAAEPANPQDVAVVSKSAVLESNVAYLRINSVATGLVDQLNTAYRALAASNKIAGVILDLRFANGDDYAAVPETAKLFTTPKNPGSIDGPLVVLVNSGTHGAAEAQAAALQKSGTALIIGSITAGEVKTFREFPLKNGERLRITTTPTASDNTAAVSHVKPDITVTINPNDERVYFADAYAEPSKPAADIHLNAATNGFLSLIDHTSEADLVREKQKDNDENWKAAPSRAGTTQKKAIRDPVLARALDLIKGLAVVRESHH